MGLLRFGIFAHIDGQVACRVGGYSIKVDVHISRAQDSGGVIHELMRG
jgi:hypothetical protein